MKNSIALYLTIAMDIAGRIANGEFPIGTKISGRTLLSSQYRVSPETIRKAIGLLKASQVVEVSQGKEVVVLSKEQGKQFIEQHEHAPVPNPLHEELEQFLEDKRNSDKQFERILKEMMLYSDRLVNLKPFNPVEVTVPARSKIIGKYLGETNLWYHTKATVIAIRRGMDFIISPGPEATIKANDSLVVVGPDNVAEKLTEYINSYTDSQDNAIPSQRGMFGALMSMLLLTIENSLGLLEISAEGFQLFAGPLF